MQVRRIFASMAAAVMVAGVSLAAPPVASAVPVPAHVVTGDVAPRAKVPVSVTVRNGDRVLVVTVDWNDRLDDRPGRDRFTVRVMAGTREVALRTWRGSRPDVQTLTVRLTASEVKAFRKARNSGDAVVAVTQQSDTNTDNDTLYERNTATAVRVPAADRRSYREDAERLRDCSGVTIEPGADLSGCDLAGVDLSGADLTDMNVIGADLSGAVLSNTDLSNSVLFNMLEIQYVTRGTELVFAPLADLRRVDLSGADLAATVQVRRVSDVSSESVGEVLQDESLVPTGSYTQVPMDLSDSLAFSSQQLADALSEQGAIATDVLRQLSGILTLIFR